uniref:Uncharacterized protein n=1 Tax=Arundo donax TaxID=35708 RepID=A0A0A9GJT9_ARUDO
MRHDIMSPVYNCNGGSYPSAIIHLSVSGATSVL